jgi:methylmalonyl-CoA epimerase
MIHSIDHIGIAVRSIEASLDFYENTLGLKVTGIEEIPERKVRLAMIKLDNQVIELVEPMSEESPIHQFLEKRGEGLHHLAFLVSDIEVALEQMKKKGVELINPKPVQGAHGRKIAFVSPKSTHGVLMEFCQEAE